MSRNLPPLDHLRAFEAAARHLSFKRAADELNVTPAAIGQRVRALEDILKCALFVRRTRQVDLTPEGRSLFEDIAPPLSSLKNSISRHWRRRDSRVLHISSTNSFTELNLLPCLPGFTEQFPSADVRILSTNKKLELTEYEADVCIRLGPGSVPGCESHSLGEESYLPVCSPILFHKFPKPMSVEQVLSLPLIEEEWAVESDAAPSWRKWAAKRDLDFQPDCPMIRVSMEAHAVRAAVQIQGVALLRSGSVKELIKAGTLIELLAPFERDEAGFSYRLLWRKDETSELVRSFVEWASIALSEHLSDA